MGGRDVGWKDRIECESASYRHVRHSPEIVYLVWSDLRYNVEQVGGVRKVPVVEEETHTGLLLDVISVD
jgi:hypothetical protein